MSSKKLKPRRATQNDAGKDRSRRDSLKKYQSCNFWSRRKCPHEEEGTKRCMVTRYCEYKVEGDCGIAKD